MNNIKIHFSSDTNLKNLSFDISVNKNPLSYTIDNNILNINSDQIVFGINLLKIKLLTPFLGNPIKLDSFYLDEAISRYTFYLAYSEKNGIKECNTWFGGYDEITIPFGNPMSWWICECTQKLSYKLFGSNLYANYEIFYPESILIDDKFPKMMQDWFKYNFRWHVFHKNDINNFEKNKQIPYFKINFKYDQDGLFDEIENKIHLIQQNKRPTNPQDIYNLKEPYSEYSSEWAVYDVVPKCQSGDNVNAWKDTVITNAEDFPLLHELLERITANNIKISDVFISQTNGHSYVAPHGHQERIGYYQITFPIMWTHESYFKLDGVGHLPTDSAFVINNTDFLHGTINPTNNVRYILGICCEFNDNYTILDYFKPY